MSSLAIIGSAIAMGLGFGYALESGQVYVPRVIVQQMLFQKFIMLKMFLSAAATSMFWMGVLSVVAKEKLDRARSKYKSQGSYAVGLGAAILGIGMALGGSCPGTVAAQVGAGVQSAYYSIAGAFAGGLAYALLFTDIQSFVADFHRIKNPHMDEVLGIPMVKMCFAGAAFLACVVAVVEAFVPHESEALFSNSWPPYLAGMLVGSLQLPGVLLVEKTIGSSSSYMALLSHALKYSGLSKTAEHPYLKKFQGSLMSLWQLIYMISAIIGSYLSATNKGHFGTHSGMPPIFSFVSGFCFLFGARMASGCTSGHGISGLGMLVTNSFIAVPCMFAGGIAAAIILQSQGLYPPMQ